MKRGLTVVLILLIVSVLAVFLYAQMRDMRSKAVKAAATTIAKEKQKLIKAGTYDCCLKNPCDQCLISMGMCPCGENAYNDKPVCHECKGGWHAGDGNIPGKTANQIKVMPRKKM